MERCPQCHLEWTPPPAACPRCFQGHHIVSDIREPSLFELIMHRDADAVRAKLKQGAFVNYVGPHKQTPLHIAALNGDIEIVRMLVNHGANINAVDDRAQTPFAYALNAKHPDTAQYIHQRGGLLTCTWWPITIIGVVWFGYDLLKGHQTFAQFGVYFFLIVTEGYRRVSSRWQLQCLIQEQQGRRSTIPANRIRR